MTSTRSSATPIRTPALEDTVMADKESKKRKRQSHGVEGQSKKHIGDGGRPINVVQQERGLHPVLVSAPGIVTPDVSFKTFVKPRSSRTAPQDLPTRSTHNLLLHSQDHPRLDFTATEIALDDSLTHYVAIYDPTTRQLQLIPTSHLSLRSTLRSEKAADERHGRTYLQQRQDLNREFGTKKSKKILAERTFNAIVNNDPKGKTKPDDVQNAILQSMPDAPAGGSTAEDDLRASLDTKPIPTPNLAAGNVEDVYPFSVLVPPSEARLVDVSEWQEKMRREEDVPFSHRFPAFRLQGLVKGEQIERLKALKYLHILLEFNDTLPSSSGKSAKKVPKKEVLAKRLSHWPDALVTLVRKRFASEANDMTKWHQQKLHTHMCALSLFVDHWATDTSNLKDDLRLETREIQQYFREIGCKVAAPTEADKERFNITKTKDAARSVRVAKLKLPLEFPQARTGRRK